MSRNYSVLALLLIPFCAAAQDNTASRKRNLEVLLRVLLPSRTPATGRINAVDKTWEDWVRRTGELPPDFESMPSIPGLPDPLVLRENGREIPITNATLWARKKQWMRSEFEKWVFGAMPPAPDNLRAVITDTHREGTTTVRNVRLEFGPDHRATLRLQLIIPDGKGPFPVFLTNHARNRPWIYTAVRRGYIACIYYATDPRYGNGDDSDKYIEIYPQYDFSCLARWAWSASRAVDYLQTMPEVAKGQIGLTGHSRNGKQALLAAAFDERIGAVIPSSGNTGECDPWRYTTDMFANESIQLLAGAQPHWFHPRLRFFSGREDKLPVDQHMLLAMVAPRGLMMYAGYAESAGNPLGFEQAYRSALRVYRLLGHEENIWLHLRDGEHPTASGDVENFIDFFDAVFGRKPHPKTETWIHGYTFEDWKNITGENIDPLDYAKREVGDFLADPTASSWAEKRKLITKRIAWVLGEEPPHVPFQAHRKLSDTSWSSEGWLATLFQRPSANRQIQARLRNEGMGSIGLPFGDGLQGELFYPVDQQGKPAGGKWPVVVWLHPYSYPTGWSAGTPWSSSRPGYVSDYRPSFSALTKRGFAVLAFDQIGFGSRVLDARDFYKRYPKWSLMGKMVSDTRAAIDALSQLDEIDRDRIYLMGYALGAKVGLLAAAMDDRVAALAAVCGFDPLRLDTPDKGTEGVRHYSHLHGLLPRLGFFVGHESRIPFDFDEVLALAAPKPVLLVAPTLDRYARVADVRQELVAVRRVYRLLGRESALRFETPEDFNRFPRRLQQRVYDWFSQMQ